MVLSHTVIKMQYIPLLALALVFCACSNPAGTMNGSKSMEGANLDSCATLAAKFIWLKENVESNKNYVIEVNADDFLTTQVLSYSGKNNITIHIKGIGTERILTNTSGDSLFILGSGVTLVLESNISLTSLWNPNNDSLVQVFDGAHLIMNEGSKLTGNNCFSIWVENIYGDILNGEIGGGVYVGGTGIFTMNGGEISNNSASTGGGVYVAANGTFIMNKGKISGNSAYNSGGGVGIGYNSTFIMNGGEITGNSAYNSGGGVYSGYQNATFTMKNDSCIINNSAASGGGVYFAGGTFSILGGLISDNSAYFNGGGVYIPYWETGNETFNKTGGTITGYASDIYHGNVVTYGEGTIMPETGHAIYVGLEGGYLYMDTTSIPGASLSFDSNNGSPLWAGSWEIIEYP